MNAYVIFAAVEFITLSAPDGTEVQVNIDQVISMRARKGNYKGEYDAAGHFTENAKCVLNTGDGKFVAVRESCTDVMRIFVETERQHREQEQP